MLKETMYVKKAAQPGIAPRSFWLLANAITCVHACTHTHMAMIWSDFDSWIHTHYTKQNLCVYVRVCAYNRPGVNWGRNAWDFLWVTSPAPERFAYKVHKWCTNNPVSHFMAINYGCQMCTYERMHAHTKKSKAFGCHLCGHAYPVKCKNTVCYSGTNNLSRQILMVSARGCPCLRSQGRSTQSVTWSFTTCVKHGQLAFASPRACMRPCTHVHTQHGCTYWVK